MGDTPYSYPDTSQVAPQDQIMDAAKPVPKRGYYDPQEESSGQGGNNVMKAAPKPKPGYYDPAAPSK